MTLRISSAQYSITGQRSENQDFHGILIPESSALENKGITVAIADGVSASDAGRLASESCVKNFLFDYYSTPDSWTTKTSAQKVLTALNRWLYSKGQGSDTLHRGMASTLSILLLKGNTAHIFHIGDSRIYLFRDGTLEQLTHDHRVWVSQHQNYLSRAVGIDLTLDIDYRTLPLQTGDVFLLTTDGIHDTCSHIHLQRHLGMLNNVSDQDARQLCEHALEQGSTDNVTCQIIRVEALPKANPDDVLQRAKQLPFPPALKEGVTIDGYKITREIHASNRTHVYEVIDIDTGTHAIMKTPSVNFIDDASYIERFMLEEWAGKRINNDHVVRIVEPTNPRRFLYYVTEKIDGISLREWMDKNPTRDIPTVQNIIDQLVMGVRAFHRQEMLHQDLKPENIMLSAQQRVIIVDFGSVRIGGFAETGSRAVNEELVGTENYTAPEYHSGGGGITRSDLFSIGIIAYELLTGKLPYGEGAILNTKKRNYVPSFHHNPLIPHWIDGALRRAVALDPTQRYDSLSEFIYDLKHPNSHFAPENQPLLQRNPLAFWQAVAFVSVVCNAILIYACLT
jgi:eukaryotic-like serine/threonine-protein kinase